METSRAFDAMIRQCEAMRAPSDVRNEALLILKYLRIQSLCDFDRRDDDRGIQRQWRTLEVRTKELGLFAWARRNPPMWFAMLDFVKCPDRRLDEGAVVGESATSADVVASVPVGGVASARGDGVSVTAAEFDLWGVEELFRTLKVKIGKVVLSEADEKTLKPSISYLLAEAQRSRAQRDLKMIKETWLGIWPILNRHGLLEEYRTCAKLKEQLQFFVMDGFAVPMKKKSASLKNVDLHRNLAKRGI